MPVSIQVRTNLVKLSVALFDAAPGATHLASLEAQSESGLTVRQIGVNLTSTTLFKNLYPDSLPSDQFVDQYLATLLGTEVAPAPLAWARLWMLDMLSSGMSRGEMLLTALIALVELPASNAAWAGAKARLDNKTDVALFYTVDKAQSSPSLPTLQDVVGVVSSDPASVEEAIAQIEEDLAPTPDPQGSTFTLTAVVDMGDGFIGNAGNDTFNGTYDAAVTDTFNAGDQLVGNDGYDTLNIDHFLDVAITPPDTLWQGLSSIESVVITTTGNGAQTLTTGTFFEDAFAENGIDLEMTTAGAGALNITMSTFTGAANLVTTTLAGAQTIITGSGPTTVIANSTGGALTIQGEGLEEVSAVTTGAGAQTILSSSANAVTVMATTGGGALTITTGAGDDTITLFSSDVAGANIITGNGGADQITLVSGVFSAQEVVVIGDDDSGITLATADSIINFVSGSDLLKMGTAGDATALTGNYVEAGSAVVSFEAALTAANLALTALNNTSAATELFAVEFDGSNAYLFNDTDSDGSADQVIILVGLASADITAAAIII